MNDMPVTPAPMPEQPKKSNTGIIIAVVAVVVLCCCCIAIGLAWQYGDLIMQSLNTTP